MVLFHSLAWSVLLPMLPEKEQIWPPPSRRSQCREDRGKHPVIRLNGLMGAGIHFYESLQKENLSRWGEWGYGMVREDFLEEVVFELDFKRCIDAHWINGNKSIWQQEQQDPWS